MFQPNLKGDRIYTAVLQGSPYQRGWQLGLKYGHEIVQQLRDFFWRMRFILRKKGSLEKRLLSTVERCLPYLPNELHEEIRGIVKACHAQGYTWLSELDLQKLIAGVDLLEAGCSFFAASNQATTNGQTIQMRILDYNLRLGVQNYPLVKICLPPRRSRDSIPFVSIGFLGLVGSLAGMNAAGVSISQIRGSLSDTATGEGTPMPVLMTKILSSCRTATQAKEMIQSAVRTNAMTYAISDCSHQPGWGYICFTAPQKFLEFEQGDNIASELILNQSQFYQKIPDVIYWGNRDGSANPKLFSLITSNYGFLDEETAIEIAAQVCAHNTIMSVLYFPERHALRVAFSPGKGKTADIRHGLNFDLVSLTGSAWLNYLN
ncbi:MAG TPA: C45 family autoproteolytic acyltransferase/hydrolase [Oculatellaceae cyanobacterium]|jgi:hypothetical protein